MIRKKSLETIRTAVQVFLVLLAGVVAAAGFLAEKGIILPRRVPACLHGTCPFGGAAAIGRLFTGGQFIPKTGAGNLFALAATLGATVFFGSLFCGWLCPLGSVQEWVWKLGKRLGLNRNKGRYRNKYNGETGMGSQTDIHFPGRLPAAAGKMMMAAGRALPVLRYVMLAMILAATYRSFNLVFSNIDPYYALFHVWTGTALFSSVAVLAMVLGLSLFIYRPWCRFLCPFGAVQGIVCKFAPVTIRRNAELCINCGACDRACLSGIRPSESLKIADTGCNRCLSCLAACPKPGALLFSSGSNKGKKKVIVTAKPAAAAAIVLLSFFIPLAAGAAWKAMPPRNTAAETVSGAAEARFSSVDELSGAMSLEEAAAASGMEAPALLETLELPEGFDISVKLRDIEEYSAGKSLRWIKEKLSPFFAR